MANYRTWYEKKIDQVEWIAQTAMLTIDASADVPEFGKASRLEDLRDGKPLFERVGCPFSGRIRAELVGKDWTRYSGWHHSDHNIRPEFFRSPNLGPDLPDGLKDHGRWTQDFAYLIDSDVMEHQRFVLGESASREEVESLLGRREQWRILPEKRPSSILRDVTPVPEEVLEQASDEIHRALEAMKAWHLSAAELALLK